MVGEFVDGDHISFEGVTVMTPDDIILVEDLTFDLPPARNLLICGPNGAHILPLPISMSIDQGRFCFLC